MPRPAKQTTSSVDYPQAAQRWAAQRRAACSRACGVAVMIGLLGLGGCGGDTTGETPGSAAKPLSALPAHAPGATGESGGSPSRNHGPSDAAPASAVQATRPQRARGVDPERPSYGALLSQQSSHPRRRFTPCQLVSRSQAQVILGSPVLVPQEAPQGPTCIYQTKARKTFIAVAMQATNFSKLRPRLRHRRRVTVRGLTAYCASYGRPMLYLPLGRGRVLSVTGPCAVAQRFAVSAVTRLKD
jgi:hypothetical protein